MRDAVEYQNVTPTGYVLIVTDDLKLPGLAQPFDMVEVHNGEIRLLKPEKLFSGKYRPWCEEDNTNASDQNQETVPKQKNDRVSRPGWTDWQAKPTFPLTVH